MSISRRSLLGALLCLAPGSALAIETTFGSPSNAPAVVPDTSGEWDYMAFRLTDNSGFPARDALVLTDEAAYAGSFTGKVRQRNENKIGILKDIPYVGGLFDDRLRGRDFDPSLQVGIAYRLGETLVLDLHRRSETLGQLAGYLAAGDATPAPTLTVPNSGIPVRNLVAANQQLSYHVTAAVLAPVKAEAIPLSLQHLAQMEGSPQQIGEVYRYADGTLLVLVRPSILTGWD